jgi:phage terminase small subunit
MTGAVDQKPKRRRASRQVVGALTVAAGTDVALAPDGTEWGPCMKALNERQRRFVLALYQVPPGHGAQVRAAKMAGYGTPTSSPETWAALASRLIHDERVQAALREHDQKVLRAAAPRALRALHGLVEDTEHRDHARGIAMVLDRTHPVETVHHVKTERRHVLVAPEKVLARIREIASAVGLDADAMPPPIDAEFTEVADEGDGDASA